MTGYVDSRQTRGVGRWKIVPETALTGSWLIVNVEPLRKHNYVLH